MSLYINFEPHSWYKGFAIKPERNSPVSTVQRRWWEAYTDDGNTYQVVRLTAPTLAELKKQITEYRNK